MRIPIQRGPRLHRGRSRRPRRRSRSSANRWRASTGPARIRSAAGSASATAPWITVVGISRRHHPGLVQPAERRRRCTGRCAQAPTDYFGIAVRTAGDPSAAAGAVRQALLRVDPTQPVFEMMTMRRAAAGADDRPAVSRRDHDGVRRPRAVPRGGRALRGDRLPGRAAAPRDRPSHRARRVARATSSG